MYIYGGHDIREGSMDNMWLINLNRFTDLDLPPEEMDHSLEWRMVDTVGVKVDAIAHQTSVVYNGQMYMFGGSKASGVENSSFYSFNIANREWKLIGPVSKINN